MLFVNKKLESENLYLKEEIEKLQNQLNLKELEIQKKKKNFP
jgi:hypothetical protein